MPTKSLKKIERRVAKRTETTLIGRLKLYFDQQDAHMLPHDQLVVLTEIEHEKITQLQAIWKLRFERSHGQTIEKIMKLYDVQIAQAGNLLRDAKDLFGKAENFSKQDMKALQIERRERHRREVLKDPELSSFERNKLISEIDTQLEKIGGLHNADELDIKELVDKLQPPDISFTTDISVLDAMEADDTDFEEIEE